MKYVGFFMLGVCPLLFSVCSCVSGTGDAARLMLGVSEPPMFLSVQAVSETEVEFRFSKPVTVASLHFSPQIRTEAIEDGSTVRVSFSGDVGPGERVTADLLARDENGNTINVLVPFRTRNNRIPPLWITELRTDYSRPRAEFIELRTFGAGNLGALRVFIASNARNPLVYEFPPVEVGSGEYITLHLRKIEDASRDELGTNLAESGGADSSPTGRDLWVPGTVKLLRRTDIVYLLDQDDRVVDAVVLSETGDQAWARSHFADAAEFLFRAGAWQSRDGMEIRPSDAVRTTGTTVTRTINRDETLAENSRSAADWYITVTSGATPGRPNNPRRHGN
ncbi:MAG: hypothetical protein FWD88_04910 [Treponema sp.]|nr:hypothetical protein [Treponema sp.]